MFIIDNMVYMQVNLSTKTKKKKKPREEKKRISDNMLTA